MPEVKAPLQIVPRGLQAFLELKVGSAPKLFDYQTLLPTLDLTTWYLSTNSEFRALTPHTVNAVGTDNLTDWTVPDFEWWWVESMGILAFTGVGEAMKFQLQIFDAGGLASATSTRFGPIVTLGASDQLGTSIHDFFMPPRTTPALLVNTITGTVDVQGTLRFTRLPI